MQELSSFGAAVDVHDPWVDPDEAKEEYGLAIVQSPEPGAYDVAVIAVSHQQFRDLGEAGIRAFGKPGALVFDIKYLLPKEASDDRL